ncbi:MAG TPA: D-2-hydroxyacid dehydrogenase [Bacillota bacterium]|jgi:D-3-phosphoglycerate dehydrogenase|nr:D-2-hydroxyacid dehydrogenase [Clostridia bacterium]NMA35987.1 3-phosphoglycerate dehydrogenase [Clostridiaceae bacterium]HPY63571.1 D-2-hydroxyacid dehydrogenase [Bacillota bacterium]MBP6162323.1 D-2-hydroxyacid dehydrogenase [Clostridia bacterium]MBP6950299.1 D-2-hydroxyacid dehydrogenase [Clostridia bacterium]
MALILANDGIDASAKQALIDLGHVVDTAKYEGDALLARLAEVDAVIVRSATKIRNPEIDAGAAGNLKLIIRGGVGVDNINVDYAEEKGIEVRNTPAASSSAVAELALGHMLSLARHIGEANVTMRQGKWLKKQYSGTEIAGKTLGLIGFGRIARSLAFKCLALGMDVIFHDCLQLEGDNCEQKCLEDVLREADYISLHVPFSGGKPLIGKEEFELMKDGVFIINCARGGVVDEDALVDAIEAGKVAGAALDVFEVEPLENERVRNCDKISLTPHIGAATAEAQARIGDNIVDIIKERL